MIDFGFTERELNEIEEVSVYISQHVCEGGNEGWAGWGYKFTDEWYFNEGSKMNPHSH